MDYGREVTLRTVSLTYRSPRMVGKKAENSPRVMIRINSRTTAVAKRMSPRTVVFQLFKILSFILIGFSQVNLNFVNTLEYLLCI